MEAMTYTSYVLVTGGSGGIGSEVCRLCPSFGFTPIIGYKTNADKANILAKEVWGWPFVSTWAMAILFNAVNTITKEIGTSGSLVAVVLGASPPPALEPFLKISKEQLSYQMNVNLIGQTFYFKT